jgi:hypothetical protein
MPITHNSLFMIGSQYISTTQKAVISFIFCHIFLKIIALTKLVYSILLA